MDYEKAYKEALEIAHKINVEQSEQTKEKILDWLEKKKSIDVLDKEEREFAENVDAFRKEIDAAYQRGYEEGKRQSKCKFSVGDIVKHSLYDGLYYIVKSIDLAGDYELECLNGKSGNNIASATENYLSLWTIKDAKPGDVLTDGNEFVIFKSNNHDPKTQYGCMFVYCSMMKNNSGWHEFWYESGGLNPTGYLLATKEQRRYFFKRMKDAGYEWNIGKLELRKKTKQEWSEDDERIRKELIEMVRLSCTNGDDVDKKIAWLEKQRKNNMGISEATKQELENNLNKVLEKETPESCNEFLEKQDEKKEEEIEKWLGCEAFPEGTNITPLPKAVEIVRKTANHFYDFGRKQQTIRNIQCTNSQVITPESYINEGQKKGIQIVLDNPQEYGLQKIAKWSEKDKKMSRFIGNAITADGASEYLGSKGIQVIDAHVWLDELKYRVQPQNTWKPSDEQMERLKGTINSLPHQEVLYSIYQDLKKLREE